MAPIGLVLLFLTGVGPLIAWRKASHREPEASSSPARRSPWCVDRAGSALHRRHARLIDARSSATLKLPLPASVICFAPVRVRRRPPSRQEFYRGTRVRQTHTKLDFFTSLIGLVARGKRRYGGYLVHVAIVLMFVGFAGDAYKKETDATLEKGKQVTLGQLHAPLRRARHDVDAARRTVADREHRPCSRRQGVRASCTRPSGPSATTRTSRRRPRSTSTATLGEDLYLVLNGYDAAVGRSPTSRS